MVSPTKQTKPRPMDSPSRKITTLSSCPSPKRSSKNGFTEAFTAPFKRVLSESDLVCEQDITRRWVEWIVENKDKLKEEDLIVRTPFGYKRWSTLPQKDEHLFHLLQILEKHTAKRSNNARIRKFKKEALKINPEDFNFSGKPVSEILWEETFRSVCVGVLGKVNKFIRTTAFMGYPYAGMWLFLLASICAGVIKGYHSQTKNLNIATELLVGLFPLQGEIATNIIRTGLKGGVKNFLQYSSEGMVNESTLKGVLYFAFVDFLIVGGLKGTSRELLGQLFNYYWGAAFWGSIFGSILGQYLMYLAWDQMKTTIVTIADKAKTD